jgi:hypothetical protein
MVVPLEEKKAEAVSPEMQTNSIESEQNYQAFINQRNKLLEEKTAEIESTPPVIDEKPLPVKEDTLITPEISMASPITTPEDTIDFSVPMAPPFMSSEKDSTRLAESLLPAEVSIAEDAIALKAELAQAEAEKAAEVEAETVRRETVRIEAEKAELDRKVAVQKEQSFFLLFDEYRAIIGHELKDLVGERKAHNMLVKTFEIAREKYPEIFRNANWDASGTLLEDGSLDGKRMAENTILLVESQREITVDMALAYLMNLRFQAIEKGLGVGFKNKLRARLFQWVADKEEGVRLEDKDTAPYRRLKSYLS